MAVRPQGARENIQGPSASAERSERRAAGGQASTAGPRPGGAPTVLPAEPLTGVRRSAPNPAFQRSQRKDGSGPPLHNPPDLPGHPFLLGFGRRPSVFYQFGLNPNYCCLQVYKFSLLKKKKIKRKKRKRALSFFPKQRLPLGRQPPDPGSRRSTSNSAPPPPRPRLFREVTVPLPATAVSH